MHNEGKQPNSASAKYNDFEKKEKQISNSEEPVGTRRRGEREAIKDDGFILQ